MTGEPKTAALKSGSDDCFALPEKERRGSCYYDCVVFYPTGEELLRQVLGERPLVDGHANSRREEVLDRGVIALRTKKGVYVGWRLLKTDPAYASFDVFRSARSEPLKLNAEPVWQTTDFVDTAAPQTDGLSYSVRLSKPGASISSAAGCVVVPPAVDGTPYLSIPLADAKETFQKIAFSDLDGDGIPDFVVKQPNSNIDPATPYWHRSETPYTLEGYRHEGRCYGRSIWAGPSRRVSGTHRSSCMTWMETARPRSSPKRERGIRETRKAESKRARNG